MSSKAAQYNNEAKFKKMLISANDYQRMGAAGIFEDKPRVELIDGEIYTMSPITPNHNSHVDKASRFFNKNLADEILVRTQGSIRIDEYSEPEPDITILRFKENYYSDKHPNAKDILLIIEVAVFTATSDRTIKKKKYASAGIPEYWIIFPKEQTIEVFRKPKNGDYLEKSTYEKTDEWIFKTFDLTIKGSDLLI